MLETLSSESRQESEAEVLTDVAQARKRLRMTRPGSRSATWSAGIDIITDGEIRRELAGS